MGLFFIIAMIPFAVVWLYYDGVIWSGHPPISEEEQYLEYTFVRSFPPLRLASPIMSMFLGKMLIEADDVSNLLPMSSLFPLFQNIQSYYLFIN